MIRGGRLILCCGWLFWLLAQTPAYAEGETCQDDVSYLFCAPLELDETYDNYNYASYRKLIYGKNGWIFRTSSDLKTDFALPATTLGYLRRLNEAFSSRGIRLVLLYLPTRGLMHSENLLPEDRKAFHYSYPDAAWKSYEASIKAMQDTGLRVVGVSRPEPGTPFFYKRDHHWNAAGAKRTAEILTAAIKKMPEYEGIEKIKFVTRQGDRYAFYGVSKKIFKKFCDTIQPPETIDKMITERADMAVASSDLFGDTRDPDIVLMGTSNSTQEPAFANFEGFLKEFLSADILNMSVSGGGLDTAVISYLNSDAYKNNPAKIAIWEVPSYYDIEAQSNFFREAIPAVYGDCGTAALASKEAIPLTESGVVALSALSKKRFSGDNYYVHLRFSKPVTDSFFLSLYYGRGHEKYKFRRSARLQADDQFFLTLGTTRLRPLDKVVLNLPQTMPGETVAVKICKVPEMKLAKNR